jgi:hypothetical protein
MEDERGALDEQFSGSAMAGFHVFEQFEVRRHAPIGVVALYPQDPDAGDALAGCHERVGQSGGRQVDHEIVHGQIRVFVDDLERADVRADLAYRRSHMAERARRVRKLDPEKEHASSLAHRFG